MSHGEAGRARVVSRKKKTNNEGIKQAKKACLMYNLR